MSGPPESVDEVLTAVAAHGLPGTLHDLPEKPLADRVWLALRIRVAQERLTGLLAAAVEDGSFPVTDQQREQVGDDHVEAMVQSLLLERAFLEATDALSAAGVPSRLLKGSAVAHLDYPDPALRPFGDVDLLIHGEDLDRAVDALRPMGMRRREVEPRRGFAARFGKGVTLIGPEGLEIDLHRTLAHGSFGFTVPLDQLWDTRSTIRLAGRDLAALGPEERLLHAAYHLVLGARPMRLLPMRDIAEMALFGTHDDRVLRDRAAAWRAHSVLARAVSVSWTTLKIADVTLLSRWAERHRPTTAEQRQLAAYDRIGDPYGARALDALPYVPGVRGKLAFASSLSLPERDFLLAHRQTRRSWLLRGLRAARSVTDASAGVRGAD